MWDATLSAQAKTHFGSENRRWSIWASGSKPETLVCAPASTLWTTAENKFIYNNLTDCVCVLDLNLFMNWMGRRPKKKKKSGKTDFRVKLPLLDCCLWSTLEQTLEHRYHPFSARCSLSLFNSLTLYFSFFAVEFDRWVSICLVSATELRDDNDEERTNFRAREELLSEWGFFFGQRKDWRTLFCCCCSQLVVVQSILNFKFCLHFDSE